MQQHRVTMKNEQLPITAIAKCPMLAIRWNIESDQAVKVRRVQLRFTSAEEYDIALNHFLRLGLRISQQQQPAQRSSTAQSASTHPSVSANVASSGPSFPPSRLSEISNRPSTAASVSSFTSAAHPSVTALQSQNVNTIRPASAYPTTMSNPLIPPVYFPRPASSSSILTLPPSNTMTVMPDQPSYSIMSLPSSSTSEANVTMSTARPNSAMLYSGPDTSELVIPPRRELPFGRSTSILASREESPPRSAGSTGAMGPPPVPSPPRSARRSPSSIRAIGEAPDMPPLPQPTFIGGTERPTTDGSSPGRLSSRGSDRSVLAQPTIMGEPASSSPLPSCTASMRGLGDLGGTAQHSRQSQSQDYLPTPPASEATYQDRIISELCKTVAVNVNEGLAAYAVQSDEGRKTALNDFMMQHIDDENFLTLVQDVSTCWSRIGLGLG
jgi:hypothetical protein